MADKTIKIKEHDLHEIVKSLMDKAIAIDRPNKEKICNFIINLVENGGKRRVAAYDAGYGTERDENGNVRTDEERKNIAGVEATRLLRDDKILAVYEELRAHKFLARVFVRTLKKEHLISVLYQAGIKALCSEKYMKSGVAALKEVGILAGFYSDESMREAADFLGIKDEVKEGSGTISELLAEANRVGMRLTDKKKLN